jgi:hypothetical protein
LLLQKKEDKGEKTKSVAKKENKEFGAKETQKTIRETRVKTTDWELVNKIREGRSKKNTIEFEGRKSKG